MANAILYRRDPTHRQVDVGFADPQNLPSTDILEFTFPDDILEGLQETYNNNIKSIPVPNQDGVRVLNIQENGLNANKITISGVFKKDIGAGIIKLKQLRDGNPTMVDTFHLFGNIGIEVDNAPQFNIDPDENHGLYIDATTLGYAGERFTRYDFSVTLGFGGTIQVP